MGGRGGGSSTRSPIVVAQQTLAEREAMADMDIRDAYEAAIDASPNPARTRDTMNAGSGPWISMVRMRNALSTLGWSRERQDTELTRFLRQRKSIMIPESNQKAMDKRDRDAALHIGNEDKHLISIKKQ